MKLTRVTANYLLTLLENYVTANIAMLPIEKQQLLTAIQTKEIKFMNGSTQVGQHKVCVIEFGPTLYYLYTLSQGELATQIVALERVKDVIAMNFYLDKFLNGDYVRWNQLF